ncbi:hypothetical protein [Stutzerimonas nitrititolerans]|uniref:hypothetical protein n=1 Tax=Stutzerimonas nitrititolerans TaxID=2482751 RepID=UPI00289EA520|nr:hypothetical protein [Stutzerimonas nitrititolerans]
MTDQSRTNRYTTDSRGERTPMPHVLRPANPNPPRSSPATQPSPRVYGFDDQPPRERHRAEPASPVEPGFYVVPRSMTAAELYRSLFEAMPPAAMLKFSALNPGLEGTIKAGSLIVLSDPDNTSCTYQEAQLMQAAQQVRAALDPLTPGEADFMARHRTEIATFLGETSTGLGVGAAMLEKHLVKLRDTLKNMEYLHQNSYRQHGHLRSPEFFAERKRLLAQLDAHLQSSMIRNSVGLGDHPSLKSALGISSQSLVHRWNKAGAPGRIPGYATHVAAVSRAAKYMQAGGYIGIGIGGVASLLSVQEVCNADPESAACRKVKFSSGGQFAGSAVGGGLGAHIGLKASAPICLALGVSTGVGGVACVAAMIGMGSLVGSASGGIWGESAGEILYERTLP